MVEQKAKKTKEAKIKPKYNIFQNVGFAFQNIWASGNKMFVVAAVARIPVSIVLTVIALYTPKIILDRLEFSETMQQMIAVITALLAVTMVFNLINNYISAKNGMMAHKMIHHFLKIGYRHYLDIDYENLENPKYKDIRQKAEQATQSNNTAAMQMPNNFAHLFINILSFIFFAGVISFLNPLILLLLSLTVVINYFMMKSVRNYEHKLKDRRAAADRKIWYLSMMSRNLTQGKDIRLYGMGDWFSQMGKMFTAEKRNLHKGVEYRYFSVSIINFIILFLRDGGAYIYLIYRAVEGDLSAGDFVLYFAAIGQFAGWLQGILDRWLNVHTASLQFCDMRESFDFPNKTNRGKGIEIELPENPDRSDGLSIELKNVSYQYPGAENMTIKNINLKIAAGEKIALVGLNGAGKTTLVKLICGMYAPTEGEILVNGHKINDYNINDYYSLFSAVFQKFRFLPISIAQNISIVPKEEADMKKLEKCVELAGLQEKLNGLDMGMDTPLIKEINNNGTELSGGEQQKLMLARAIYKDAPILVLDEPTAALDPIAESEMYMKYNEIAKDKTSVFISHRLASTRFCNKIILIADGEISESGTHDELVKQGGKYAELFDIQSHYYKDNINGKNGGEIS